jgi:hypothetical protein
MNIRFAGFFAFEKIIDAMCLFIDDGSNQTPQFRCVVWRTNHDDRNRPATVRRAIPAA